MREFKLRVWDSYNKKMNYQDEVIIMLDKGGICTCFDTGSKYRHFEDLEKDLTYMQYTGLKDKNGKEIYEGDIVKYESPYFKIMGKIIFGFYVEWFISKDTKDNLGEIRSDLGHWVEVIEVVGNIYENLELLNNK